MAIPAGDFDLPKLACSFMCSTHRGATGIRVNRNGPILILVRRVGRWEQYVREITAKGGVRKSGHSTVRRAA